MNWWCWFQRDIVLEPWVSTKWYFVNHSLLINHLLTLQPSMMGNIPSMPCFALYVLNDIIWIIIIYIKQLVHEVKARLFLWHAPQLFAFLMSSCNCVTVILWLSPDFLVLCNQHQQNRTAARHFRSNVDCIATVIILDSMSPSLRDLAKSRILCILINTLQMKHTVPYPVFK